jgi:hypothetical protein
MQRGVASVVGLTFKGIYEEIQKKHGKTVDSLLQAMLILQGYNEVKDSTVEDRTAILEQWKGMEVDSGKGKK